MSFIAMYIMLCSFTVRFNDGHTMIDVERLHTYLFHESRYNKQIRPSTKTNYVTQVNISQSLTFIKEIDVSTGRISAPSFLYISWFDTRLTWDPTEYGDITYIPLPKNAYWEPELILVSGSDNEDTNIGKIYSPAWLKSNGEVSIITGEYFNAQCTTDTNWFPFDSQKCLFYIGSTMYDASEMYFNPTLDDIDLRGYTLNTEWDIVTTKSLTVSMNRGGVSFVNMPYLINTLVVARRPAFIIIHSIFPIGLLDMLCTVTCFIHPNSGERLSFAISVFLSFVFLGNAIVVDLPKNSLDISLTSVLVVGGNSVTSLGILWSVLIVRISNFTHETKPIPRVLRKLAIWSRQSRKPNSTSTVRETSIQSDDVNSAGKHVNGVCLNVGTTDEDNNKTHISINPEVEVTWLEVALILDKMYASVLIMATFILIVTVLIIAGVNDRFDQLKVAAKF